MNDITQPEFARRVFRETQTMRIPFTKLNCSITDMLDIYAEPHLPPQVYGQIRSKLLFSKKEVEDINSCFLYMFGESSYSLFLQMIAKEDSFSWGTRIYTSGLNILFSQNTEACLDACPTFNKGDKSFWDITATQYAKEFSKDNFHLLQVKTKKATIGKKATETTDYCLYIPGGESLPKVIAEINRQKNNAINSL